VQIEHFGRIPSLLKPGKHIGLIMMEQVDTGGMSTGFYWVFESQQEYRIQLLPPLRLEIELGQAPRQMDGPVIWMKFCGKNMLIW